ncbi:MAG: DNA mismatch repair endonuclease MutL [Dehalococcoidia bacterium]
MNDHVVAVPPRIRLLPPEVAARIAAGEVIERPASVVKELVENALDAGARTVDVEIDRGGCDRIRVRDDGCGIPADQLADAFERHATSKLRDERDLFAVRTLGFRGEALAAIVAAGDVEFVTRPRGESAAALARYRDGRRERLGSAGAAAGTSVEVRDLFAALPARRSFLRAPQSEARAVAGVLQAYALARPDVAFRLTADGRQVLVTDGSRDPRAVFAALFGERRAGALLEVREERVDEGGSALVSGLVGAPSEHQGNRRGLFLFANGRAIVSRALSHAVEQAYHALLPAGRFPIGVLHVDVPPDEVDVNVHPTKAEVRFRHERLLYAVVTGAVREALHGAPAPAWTVPAAPERAPWETGRVLLGARPATRMTLPVARPLGGLPDAALQSSGVEAAGEALQWPGSGPATPAAARQDPLPLTERLPALRALGQVDATYLVAEAPDGLYLVDQHAAHERVLYERVAALRLGGQPERQPLLTAIPVTLSATQALLVEEQADTLAAFGFTIERADGTAVIVRAVPALLSGQDPARALVAYLERFEAETRLSGPDRAVASLACRAAVMAGDRLDLEQQRALLVALERTETPQTCPHGRPTLVHVSSEALARSFGRR